MNRLRRFRVAVPLLASVVGVIGFGTLYRGLADGSLPLVLLGLALALVGLDRAGRALAGSMVVHRDSRAPALAQPGPAGARPEPPRD